MIDRRLVHLMVARLVVVVLTLGAAVAVIGAGGDAEQVAERGLYGIVAFAFLVTAVHAAWLRRVRRPVHFAAVQLVTDLAIVTGIVACSGGSGSLFTFLYVPLTVYAAMLLGRRGAYGAAALASLAIGAVMVGEAIGWGPAQLAAPPLPLQIARWGVHAGALLLVALLASALTGERDRADRALHERTRDLDALRRLHERTVESLTSGLLTTDLERRVTSFNPEAERITGSRTWDVLGRPLEAVVPGAAALLDGSAEREAKALRRSRLPYRGRKGEELYLGLASSVLREADGSPRGYVVIFQDVTRVVEMERELRRKERMAAVGRLAASLAHEIRNPLAAISGSIQMLHCDGEKDSRGPEAQRLMSIVLRETSRLDGLIGDFLQYARPVPTRRARVALKTLLDEAIEILEPVRPDSVTVTLEVQEGLCLEADAGQLRQLFWNLFGNAVDAMPDGGNLRIEARRVRAQAPSGEDRREAKGASECVEILVSDTGVGIADDDLDRIFDPFFTTKPDGTGLGLATVHQIVEGHGGELNVESQLRQGTTFRMRFPEEAA